MNLVFDIYLFVLRSDFLHAINLLQDEADRFTSPAKEGVMRIFIDLKNATLRPGFSP
jgi:hypothetical protein